DILRGLGVPSRDADRTVDMFRVHDEELLKRQHAIYQDERAMIENVLKSRAELQSLFEMDASEKLEDDDRQAAAPYG
ncbi:MAG: glutathione-regulated potassium-efflux system protein KefB, partial [Gammaproteobacteria bacterium]